MGFRRVIGLLVFVGFASACAAPRPAESPPPPAPTPAAEPPVAPPPPPANVACRGKAHVCAEFQGVSADDATKLREKCAAEGGDVLEACPADKVVGTCTAARATATVRQHVYRAKTGRETRSLVFDSKRACESKGGTFTAP